MRGLVIGVILTMAAACGGSGSNATRTSATTARVGPSTSTVSSSGGSTSPVSIAPTQPTAHLVAVRAARQGATDRVVFEFTERVPGYNVAYSSEPLVDTSGRRVTVTEPAVLVVRMESASGFNLDTGKPTYTGAKQVQPADTQAVEQVAQVDDFEGVLRWAIGMHSQTAFRVSTLASPPRLVIDVGA
ncbi:MAG: hypothetical protein JO086_10435 [Acidimicrobiia bacterium]|nr:hypothetical protein [Acidimicrobiia bacterium]